MPPETPDAPRDPQSPPSPPAEPNLKISIITPVFNAEKTIAGTIASVAAQSHGALEHVVMDGGSRDGTQARIAAAAEAAAAAGSRVDLKVFSEPDDGIYDAINRGIARATGDVVGLVHGDDYLAHGEVLAGVAAAFEDPRVEAVFGDLDYVAQNDTGAGNQVIRHWVTGAFSPARLRRGWMPPHPTLYLRRAVLENLGGYDTSFRIAADYDLILRYFSQTKAAPVYLPEVLYKMRVGGVSNRDLAHIAQKSREDLRALRQSGVGGLSSLALKNVSKLTQFITPRLKRGPSKAQSQTPNRPTKRGASG